MIADSNRAPGSGSAAAGLRWTAALLLGAELCFFLLIVQTGIVEFHGSALEELSPLPIGGLLGSVGVGFLTKASDRTLRTALGLLLALQLALSFSYPEWSAAALLAVSIVVGAAAPLALRMLGPRDTLYVCFALVIAYVTGTALFSVDPALRAPIGAGLSFVALLAILLMPTRNGACLRPMVSWYPELLLLFVWAALDSCLFEILSRSNTISIWRGGHTAAIISFHVLGVVAGYRLRDASVPHHGMIAVLFLASYAAALAGATGILAVVYPFVISYYNFRILELLLRSTSLHELGLAMALLGCVSSGVGLVTAVRGWGAIPVALFAMAALVLAASRKRESLAVART